MAGTRFRTMLAPVGASTGDGRRFAPGALTLAPTPFPFEWARERDIGHDGAVVIGAVQSAEITDDGIWAEGVIFDDVDREEMPRLAEDVAEALKLIGEGVLGPSVDLDSFEGIPVREGTDDPITEEDWDDPDLRVELLVTEGRVRAATLVSIPAFVETVRPLELMPSEDDDQDSDTSQARAALVASTTLPDTAAFDVPEADQLTPITADLERGLVYGHVAAWNTCHVGFGDVCVTPPRDPAGGDYPHFHRFPVETDDGLVWAGRLTAGGRHPSLTLTASQTMAAYDGRPVAAYVRARDGKLGIWVSGPLAPDLDDRVRAVLSRRKVSGDWRETEPGLSMLELLALSPGPRAHSEPGFPIAVGTRQGRQVALTASLGVVSDTLPVYPADEVSRAVAQALRVDRARERERTALAAVVAAETVLIREAARQTLARALEVPVELLEDAS